MEYINGLNAFFSGNDPNDWITKCRWRIYWSIDGSSSYQTTKKLASFKKPFYYPHYFSQYQFVPEVNVHFWTQNSYYKKRFQNWEFDTLEFEKMLLQACSSNWILALDRSNKIFFQVCDQFSAKPFFIKCQGHSWPLPMRSKILHVSHHIFAIDTLSQIVDYFGQK